MSSKTEETKKRNAAQLEAENISLRAELESALEHERAYVRAQERHADAVQAHSQTKAGSEKLTAEVAGYKRFLRLVRDLINHELGEHALGSWAHLLVGMATIGGAAAAYYLLRS